MQVQSHLVLDGGGFSPAEQIILCRVDFSLATLPDNNEWINWLKLELCIVPQFVEHPWSTHEKRAFFVVVVVVEMKFC